VQGHYREIVAWGVPALGLACVLAAVVAVPPPFVDKLVAHVLPESDSAARQEIARRQRPRIVAESAWSAAFLLYPDRVPHLGVILLDGTYLFGRLLSRLRASRIAAG